MNVDPTGQKTCPWCGRADVYPAYVEDGSRGDWCPHCKRSIPQIAPLTLFGASPVIGNRIISGFWRRLAAFGIDCLILFLLAFIPAKILFQASGYLGAWERLIGFAVALLYFGLFDSYLGHGHTPGQGLMKIEVVDQAGLPISVGRAFLRFTILGLPWFLNQAPLPFGIMLTPLGCLISLLLFGLGGAIVYLAIFNRRVEPVRTSTVW